MGLYILLAFGLLGAVCNVTAAVVICRAKKLRSIFNQILACNLALHTAYILATLACQVYKRGGGSTYSAYSVIFSNFLYAFKPMLMHSTTCMMVLMARERYKVGNRSGENEATEGGMCSLVLD